MSTLQIDEVLRPVSEQNPCGEDLSYDPAFMELEQLAAGKPEQVSGDSVIAAEEPDWKELRKRCMELMQRSKDLRVAVYLALALLKLDGLGGFAEGLGLIRRMLEQQWDHLHPALDPEDNNDPTLRVNTLSALARPAGTFGDPMMFQQRLREAPLCASPVLGRFSLRDLEVASGEAPPADASAPKIEAAAIEAAFADTPVELLQANAAALEEGVREVKAMDAALVQKVGSRSAIDFKGLEGMLGRIRSRLNPFLSARGLAVADDPGPAGGAAASAGVAGGGTGASGEIRTKQDVIHLIDRICDFYAQNEPSSPVPLLLKRAQRLVSKNFLEIIKDLNPDALRAIEMLAGIESQTPPQ
jgi:type VI secretion system protein ImpA